MAIVSELLSSPGVARPKYVYVKEWHKQNMSISTTMRPTVADVMCNVNQPWKFGGTPSRARLSLFTTTY